MGWRNLRWPDGVNSSLAYRLLALFATDVYAGEDRVDVDVRLRACGGTPSTVVYDLRKEQGGTAVTTSITEAEFEGLVSYADTFEDFDEPASTTLGDWYDNLPSTGSNDGKAALWSLFDRIRAAG